MWGIRYWMLHWTPLKKVMPNPCFLNQSPSLARLCASMLKYPCWSTFYSNWNPPDHWRELEGFGQRGSAVMKLMEIREGLNKNILKWVGRMVGSYYIVGRWETVLADLFIESWWPDGRCRYFLFFIESSPKFVCMDNILSSESDCLVSW